MARPTSLSTTGPISEKALNFPGSRTTVKNCAFSWASTSEKLALWVCGIIIFVESTTAHAGSSAECERVSSNAKKMVTAERNRLSEDIIQACECLKAWWDNGFME